MVTTKPTVAEEVVLRLLGEIFEGPVANLKTMEDGQIAQTFGFSAQGRGHFVQFNHANQSQAGKTEAFFREQFELNAVPIRRVVAQGTLGELHYNVSEEVRGVPLTSLSGDEFITMVPPVIDQLLRIGRVDTSGTTGYGWLDASCRGKFTSWSGHLLGILNEDPDDFYGLWHRFFTTTFLEREKFEHYFRLMESLVPGLPDLRRLVHGDFGYGNVFIANGQVSALLDWQNCRFGDPVFDLAGMMFWRDFGVATEIFRVYRTRAEAAGAGVADLDQRVRCYMLYLGLDGLRFSARTDNRGMYDYVLTILEKVASGRQHG